MAKHIKNGLSDSKTLLRGMECLWLGFHNKVSDYSTTAITHPFFKEQALKGHIGIVRQAGLYGAEIEFPLNDKGGIAKLNIAVEELLPMTTQQADELRESSQKKAALGRETISNNKEATTVSTQTKVKSQMVSTKQGTYKCVEEGCSFSSSSPQGLGTHRVKTHNLQPQKRSNGRKVLIMKTKVEVVKPVSNTIEKIVSPGTTIKATPNTSNDWKARHDAVMKRYNRLSIRYDTVMKALKKLSDS